ncbi:DUF397 domain-containing protein [Streptomyces tuirus]|uniref:DUF397 domain-containing protein n=1 Tax=Streptomyces tuirus TaxID=68278 RepID=A0A941FC81_9ACTN|nr:DUF397 domain-containing protein [Streptomyces tuirus]
MAGCAEGCPGEEDPDDDPETAVAGPHFSTRLWDGQLDPEGPDERTGGDQPEEAHAQGEQRDSADADSKATGCPALLFSAHGWAAFVTAVKKGHIKA